MKVHGTDPLAGIPLPAERRLALRVTPASQRALRQGHPWLFASAITSQSGEGSPGDLAVIFDDRRRFLAIGLYDPTSPLRVRILHHGAPRAIDRAWLAERLAAAAAWRATLPETGTTGYRLVHGENDGLPGLVIDRYAETLVLKLYTLAWLPRLAELRATLDEVCPAERLVLRLSRELLSQPAALYGLSDGTLLAGHWLAADSPQGGTSQIPPDLQPSTLNGLTTIVQFTENHLRFEADVVHGQKTGFFFDQRDNRVRVGRLAAGRRVLNVFAYSGGFSLYAAAGGAPEVTSLDVSAGALATADRNFALNQDLPEVAAARHTLLVADAFTVLDELRQQGRQYDLVIVDPPALAHRAADGPEALWAYGRLTVLALGVLAPGGTLVQASCTRQVGSKAFFEAVNRAAAQVGRPLAEIDRTGHAIDHPVLFPEGAYLKCLFATAP
jgi:23S rRNA (cytosine1962-C5)-methyltransferase